MTRSVIVIVNPEIYGVHGIARYVQSLARNLTGSAARIILLTGSRQFPLALGTDVEIINIRKPKGRLGLVLWSLAARREIARLKRRHPELIVNHQVPPLLPALLIGGGQRAVVTAHTTYYGMSGQFSGLTAAQGQWGKVETWVKKWLERRIFRNASRIIALTEQGRAELAHYDLTTPIVIEPNGVDTAVFTPRPVPKRYDVLFAGRIEQRKGSRPMVALCRELVERDPAIQIAIVGHGDDELYVRDGLKALERNVEFLGKIAFENMPDLYAKTRLYASTSYYEGLPGTCLEAMASGVVPVVWDLMFYDGLVEGNSGVRVPCEDVDAFAQQVLKLLGDDEAREAMGKEGVAVVRTRYGWDTLADRIVSATLGQRSAAAAKAPEPQLP
jgi:glycosyltransferase involved in cell wall biosynthesis